ncbi:mitochondrial large subunit ribosomal protein-domain-containing protein [Phlyctochytrium arcticum]|nr:mitochondrial large subunit ribosomal protein-domain-containing protein [Phlyctochytrium arcticum]
MSLLQRCLGPCRKALHPSAAHFPLITPLSRSPLSPQAVPRRHRGALLGHRPKPIVEKTQIIGDPAATTFLDGEPMPTKADLPYEVKRTSGAQWLPVYREIKVGGTQVWTKIRRINGSVERLAKDLEWFIPADKITIKPVEKHVILRGDYLYGVRDFLTARGF